MVNYLTEQILDTTIFISPTALNTDIIVVLLKQLKEKIENRCNHIGYVLNNSTNIIKKSMGVITTNNNNTSIKYNIQYKCSILSPSVNGIIDCYVNNKNKMGVICYIKLSEIIQSSNIGDNLKDSPLIIIIPLSRAKDIDSINIGDKIQVKVNAIRNKYREDKIQVVATNDYE